VVWKWKTQFVPNAASVFQRSESASPQQIRIAESELLACKFSLETEAIKSLGALEYSAGKMPRLSDQMTRNHAKKSDCAVLDFLRFTHYHQP